MNSQRLSIDDALIISRLHYKELLEIKPNADLDTQYFPLVTTSKLEPFFDNLPINMGFTLYSVGNQIISVRPERGYLSKGLSSLLARQNIHEAMRLVSLLNYEAPLFYETALLLAFDNLCEYSRPKNVYQKLAFFLEMLRVVHHARVVANVLKYLKLFTLADMAEYAHELLREQTLPFSALKGFEGGQALQNDRLLEIIDYLMQLFLDLSASIKNHDTVYAKLAGKFSISLPLAANYGLSGAFLRSNRHFLDMRWHSSQRFLYQDVPAKCLCEGGDAYARFTLRFLEIHASLQWLKHQLSKHKEILEPVSIILENLKPKKSFCHREIEGPEGIIKVSIFGHHEENFSIKLRLPAYFIAQAIPHMMQLHQVFDLPLLLFSLGISADEVDL